MLLHKYKHTKCWCIPPKRQHSKFAISHTFQITWEISVRWSAPTADFSKSPTSPQMWRTWRRPQLQHQDYNSGSPTRNLLRHWWSWLMSSSELPDLVSSDLRCISPLRSMSHLQRDILHHFGPWVQNYIYIPHPISPSLFLSLFLSLSLHMYIYIYTIHIFGHL